MLRELVCRNEDTLFVLKQHPGVIDFAATEIADLDRLRQRAEDQERGINRRLHQRVRRLDGVRLDHRASRPGCSASRRSSSTRRAGTFRGASVHRGTSRVRDPRGRRWRTSEHETSAGIAGFDALERDVRERSLATTLAVGRRQEPPPRRPLHRATCSRLPESAISFRLPEARQAYKHNLFICAALGVAHQASDATHRRSGVSTATAAAASATSGATRLASSARLSRPQELAELEAVNA